MKQNKMKNKLPGLVACAIIVLAGFSSIPGCAYDKELSAPPSNCPDTVNISYSAKIRPILQANCFSCHGNGASQGNIRLDSYDQVKQLASSGHLLGAISQDAGFTPMPLGAPKLDQCNITAVATWIEEGIKDN